MIPFLFFAFAGTTTLTFIGLTSQQNLIKEEEKKGVLHYYHQFLERVEQKKIQALSLATMIAENPEVQKLLAERNRQALNDSLIYTFVGLKEDFGITQFHFHVPPATSFLRLHQPKLFGDDMSPYRKTVLEAVKSYNKVAGLEQGKTGFGIRGVVPIFHDNRLVGTVEIGHSFGESFLDELNRSWDIDLALYEIRQDNNYEPVAMAGSGLKEFLAGQYLLGQQPTKPTVLIAPESYPDRSILFGPVRDFSGKVVALVEVIQDRSEIQAKLCRTRNLMITVGLAGIAISFLLTYLAAILFIRPIKEIVTQAQDIAQEKRESRLEARPADEIGTLTQALNIMLDALKERRIEIEEHAITLEKRVKERTSDLLASEEKYRTLVENVPLIVYRVLRDGTTEFVNSHLTESLGYTAEEAVGNKRFWLEKICENGGNAQTDFFGACLLHNEEEYRVERSVRHKDGRLLSFIDLAIPTKDDQGDIKWIDGIMMDISELKRLQQRALQAEEIKILGEISARIAHEIRNPLVTAGGFSRRLRDSLPEHDPNHKIARIIVGEVARLENFLKILLSSIRPFDLCLSEVDVNHLLDSWLVKLDDSSKSRGIEVLKKFSPDIPKLQADDERLNQAFESLLKHAILSMPRGEKLYVCTDQVDDGISVTISHKTYRLSEDDLEKFFFPHIGEDTDPSIADLPLSKIIVHRHGGEVDIVREEDNMLVVRIELPLRYKADSVMIA
jgi:PAS domain S-box-containing protein